MIPGRATPPAAATSHPPAAPSPRAVTLVDCLARGLANLRANLRLVPLVVVRQWLVTILTIAATVSFIVPFFVYLGFASQVQGLKGLPREALGEELAALAVGISGQGPWSLVVACLLGLVPAVLFSLLAAYAHSWFTAGVFAVLGTGEAGAERVTDPSAERATRPLDWRTFRTGRQVAFRRAAARHAWPYFWYINLFVISALLAVLGAAVVVALAVRLAAVVPVALAVLLAVAGVSLFVACGALIGLTYLVGLPELVRRSADESGAVTATARWAWHTLRRRWWMVLLLGILYLGFDLAVGFGQGAGWVEGLPESGLAVWFAIQAVAFVGSSLFSAALLVALYGALVALSGGRPGPQEVS